jgi:hypothetical protein
MELFDQWEITLTTWNNSENLKRGPDPEIPGLKTQNPELPKFK